MPCSGLVKTSANARRSVGEPFAWYNSLPLHAFMTASVLSVAAAARGVLRKVPEPGCLFLHALPASCEAISARGGRHRALGLILGQRAARLAATTPSLRRRAATATLQAFGALDMAALRSQIQHDHGPHRLDIGGLRLRAFLGRALSSTASDDR